MHAEPPTDHAPPQRTGLVASLEIGRYRLREYRIWPGYTFPLHAHCSPGLVVGMDGRFTAEMDGLPFHVEPGQVLILPPGEIHCESAGALGARCLLVEPLARPSDPGRWTRPRAARTQSDPTELAGFGEAGTTGADPALRVARFVETVTRPAGAWRAMPVWLREAWVRAQDEPEHWTVASLARAVRVTPETLYRGFVAFFGTAPSRCLRANRLERAARRLRTSGAPLSQVALASGFSDQSHLTNRFVERFGLTPRQMRIRAG